jgi:putative oxidoreductase
MLTPFAALLVIGVMVVAIVRVHWSNGFFARAGGWEYPLALMAMSMVLGLLGAGSFSLDGVLGLRYPEPQTFLLGLVLFLVYLGSMLPSSAWLANQERQATAQRPRSRTPAPVS